MADQDVAAAIRGLGAALAAEMIRSMQEHLPPARRGARVCEPSIAEGVDDARMLAVAARAIQMYAETHPRPTQVTIGQAAEMLGIGRWKATQLVKVGTLRINACGLVPIEQVDQARTASG
jgi:hypothetical protein